MEDEASFNKRRMPRACDRCREKKIRCDDVEQGNRCSNCIVVNVECTYAAPAKKRGHKPIPNQDSAPGSSNPQKRKYNANYVADLERRAEELERMLKEVNPDIILPKGTEMQWMPRHVPTSMQGGASRPASHTSEMAELDDDFVHLDLGEKMKNLSLKHHKAFSERCFGPSSTLAFFMSALSTKKKVTGSLDLMQLQDYSSLYPWEHATADAERSRYVFPDNDLITGLVSIYFETTNTILPILHRPTFMKDVANGLHLRDESFGCLLLLILAVASRYSDDPRVLANPGSKLSAGWRFLVQVPIFQKAVMSPPNLHDIQGAALGAVYIIGTSVPQFSWTVIGMGLRNAIEIGLHRRKPGGYKLTADDELKKRSFWALVMFDRLLSLHLGRPIMIQEEDLDLELPVECDDEYWDIGSDGEVHFCQPANEPSKISYFNAQIQLSGIMSVVVRMLYSINKGRNMWGLTGKGWEERLVCDIDSSMNAWMNTLPNHLRWDPDRDNKLFLYQSAVLYNTYYMLQIHIHRPFLRTASPLSELSLIISTAAARSCTRILQVHLTRIKTTVPPILMAAFMSGTILAMNIWSSKRAGRLPNADDLAGFEQCLATFIHAADTWNLAGRSVRTFKTMASVETANVLGDSTIPATTHLGENAAPASAVIWDSSSDTLPEQVQQFDPAYWNNYLATHAEPLDLRNEDSSQSLFFDIPKSGGLGTIDTWTTAPPGFSCVEWDTYVNNMSLDNGHSGRF